MTRVQAAIEELNHRSNLVALLMRVRRAGWIAILLPTATIRRPLRLMSGAAATAHAAGYVVDILGLKGSGIHRLAWAEELAESGEFEGVLALGSLASGRPQDRQPRS